VYAKPKGRGPGHSPGWRGDEGQLAVANRIQTGIMRIGEGLNRDNLRYDWWKVRYINSNFCWPPILLLEAFFSQT
jgi:hypothetical protein